MLKVLYAASEAAPFTKTGGLGDVAGSFPQAVHNEGIDIRVVLPKYSSISPQYRSKMKHIYKGTLKVAWREKYLGIEELKHNGITYYFIDNEDYFKHDGIYGYDDAERFTFFSKAILAILPQIDFWPDIIHLNDWQTGLVSAFLKLVYVQDKRYRRIKTIFTIHNLKYQGIFAKSIMGDILGIDTRYFDNGDFEFYDNVNFMKASLLYADELTTVSKSYAKEIQSPYFGEQLDGVLRRRKTHLHGITNGIAVNVYNSQKDKMIAANFTNCDALEKKPDNKVFLQKKLGLPINRRVPMLAFVSRLVEAKGVDLLIRILDELLQYENIQFILLGTGDYRYEEWFQGLQWRFPTKVSVNINFDNKLAHQIYASATHLLMPSRYEPCGISQMIALRYGTIPIAHSIGGLKDTVIPYSSHSNTGNGFTFANYNAHELLFSIKRALEKYNDVIMRRQMINNAMSTDCSWSNSAKQYITLYKEMLHS